MTHPAPPAFVAGLDLGSTGFKLLLLDTNGHEYHVAQRPTPWRAGPDAVTQLDAHDLVITIRSLLNEAADQLLAAGPGGSTVAAVAISGMGESGFLVDDVDGTGSALAPAIAWFDAHGRDQIDRFPPHLAAEFAGRTGLPVGAQVSVAKLLYLRDRGIALNGSRWLGMPEFAVAALGGDHAAELSLISRTGLLDQDTDRPWPQMLAHLGVDPDFVPPIVTAGSDLGTISADWAPAPFRGARLTVAGHDHLVAATAGGASADGTYYASMGTAEVLVRVLDAPLPAGARTRLAEHLINHVHHIVADQHVLVAGVKTGLLMRRALQLAGITDRSGRDRLDAQVMALPDDGTAGSPAVTVSGARNDDGTLAVAVHDDGVGPAELLAAVLHHGNQELARLIAVMDQEMPPARATLLTGGWAGMRSVQRARSHVLPGLTVSTRNQDTAYGAALLAARLLPSATSAPFLADAR